MLPMSEIKQRLLVNEGFRSTKYKCTAGYWTIGVGRNLDAQPNSNAELGRTDNLDSGITKAEAFILLENDINSVLKAIHKNIPFFANLDDERQYALVDMVFQMGISGVLKFKKMLSNLGVGNYKQAAVECLDSKYAKDTPNRATRVAECIETGKYRYS